MHTYEVNVTRDDRWWMIVVPELDGYVTKSGAVHCSDTTQARRLSDVEREARDFICTVTDKAPSEVAMNITITVDGIDLTERTGRVRNHRKLADQYAALAQEEAKALARDLAARGVAVRDVGEALGVSFQRAQQLTSA